MDSRGKPVTTLKFSLVLILFLGLDDCTVVYKMLTLGKLNKGYMETVFTITIFVTFSVEFGIISELTF